MPPTHTTEGLAAAHVIRRRHPGMAILVLSQYVETRYALELLRDDPAGIGYVLKDHVSRLEDLADAVRRVCRRIGHRSRGRRPDSVGHAATRHSTS